MADTELESMIVKLKGDATSYDKMVKDAETSIRRMTGTMKGEDTKIQDLARRSASAVMAERKKVTDEAEKERMKAEKQQQQSLKGMSVGAIANTSWSIMEKSFIQSIRSVDAMMSRTVASITNGIEGVVRVSLAASGAIASAWLKSLNTITGGLSNAAGRWIGFLGGKLGDVGSFVNKWMGRIPEAIGTTLGGVGSVVGTILAGAFGIAGAAVLAFGGEMTRVFRETLDFNSTAKKLGVTILDIRAGMLLTGATFSAFTSILTSAQTKIEEYKDGVISTTNQWKNFAALSKKSISDLQKGGWEGILSGLQAIEDKSDRAAVAFSILGTEAGKVLGALERGGVGEAKSFAKRLGLDVDPASMRSLQQIAQFTREVEALKTGLVNQVMLGLAPIAAELSSVFSLSKTDITWIKDTVTDIALEIGRWGAMITATFSDPAIMKSFFDYIRHSFDDLMHSFEVSFLRMVAKVARATPLLGSGIADKLELEARRTEIHRKVPQGRADFAIRHAMQEIRESPIMQAFNDFKKNVLNSKNFMGPMQETKNVPMMIEKLNQSFDQLINSLKQPIDMWRQSLNELIVFSKTNRFKGLGDQQALAAAQMFKNLKEATGMAGNPMFAGVAAAGSTEAYTAIAQFNAMQSRGDIQQQMKDAIEQGNRQRDLLIANGQAVIKALNDLGVKFEEETEVDL